MKTKIAYLSLALVALFLITSCQSKKTEVKKVNTASSESVISGTVKEDIIKIVNTLPSNTETVNLINATGAAYLAGYTGEDMKTDVLLTRDAKAKAYGTLIFDLAYTHTYNQVESFSKLLKLYESLTKELGFEELVNTQRQFQDSYQKNKDNKDSVNLVVTNMLNKTNELIQKSGSAADVSLVVAGAVVKSLNVMSHLTLLASNKEKLIEVMKKQKTVINGVCEILKKTSDDSEVNKLYKALLPVNELYNSSEAFTAKTVEDINNRTEFISK